MDNQTFYNPAGSTTQLPKARPVSQSPYFKRSASKPSGQSWKPTKGNKHFIPTVDLTGPIPEKKVTERQEARGGSTKTQGKSSIVNDNTIRKTSVGARDDDHNSDDHDFLPKVEDLISGKYWRGVSTAGPGPGLMTAEQPAGNRGRENGVFQNKYGAGTGAGTRVSVNSKDKTLVLDTGKLYSSPSHHSAQNLEPTTLGDQTGCISISSLLSNTTASHPGAYPGPANDINSSQSLNNQNHNISESADTADQEKLAFSPTPFENSNQGTPQIIINDTGVRGEESVPDCPETMHRRGSGSDNASDHANNQNANTLWEQGSGQLDGLDRTRTIKTWRSDSLDELAGEKLQDESAVRVSDFCTPSPTEVDTDDVYGKYLRSKEADSRQDGHQHSEQTPSRSDSAIEHCISSNPAESDASTGRAYSQRAHQENAISEHSLAKNVNRLDPVCQLSLEQQSQYAPLSIEAPLSSIDAPPRNTPAQKRSASSINPSVPPQDGQSAKRRKSSRGKTVKAKKVKKIGQLPLLDPHKENTLLYAYPPNEKNSDYTVECVEAVQLTDDGSMLSTVRWTSLEVPTDSLVGEEYHSQFKSLFKTKFGEKEWDLQREKRLQKMRRYPRHGEDNDYIVEYVEALHVAEDGSVRCTVRWASSAVSEDDLGKDLLKQAEKLFKEKYGGEKWEQQLRKKQEATN